MTKTRKLSIKTYEAVVNGEVSFYVCAENRRGAAGEARRTYIESLVEGRPTGFFRSVKGGKLEKRLPRDIRGIEIFTLRVEGQLDRCG